MLRQADAARKGQSNATRGESAARPRHARDFLVACFREINLTHVGPGLSQRDALACPRPSRSANRPPRTSAKRFALTSVGSIRQLSGLRALPLHGVSVLSPRIADEALTLIKAKHNSRLPTLLTVA
jgi:hypothetical protein